MNGILVLAQRELVRFFRQRTRLFGSLAQPLLFWLLMGSGFADSFVAGELAESYSEFFFPGVALMLLLFGAIFSTITLIEDRAAGFLQGVMVAPVSRVSIVLGKVIGGTSIAVIQATIFLVLAPFAGFEMTVARILGLVGLFALVGVGFTGLGFCVAWMSETVAGYHAIMSMVMLPLWLLSGALFPLERAAEWLRLAMLANPVTYAMQVIRGAFYESSRNLMAQPDYVFAVGVTALWALTTVALSVWVASRKTAT